VLKKLLSFSNHLGLEINDGNFENVIQVIDAVNSFAPEKMIHLEHYTSFKIPDDLLIFEV